MPSKAALQLSGGTMEEVKARALMRAISSYKYERNQEKFTEQKDYVNLELFLQDIKGNKLLYRSGAAIVIEFVKNKNPVPRQKCEALALYKEKREVYNKTEEGQRCPLPGTFELVKCGRSPQVSTVNGVDFLLLNEKKRELPWFTNEQLHALGHYAWKKRGINNKTLLTAFIKANTYTNVDAVVKALLVDHRDESTTTQDDESTATAASGNSNKPSVVSDVEVSDVEYLPHLFWTGNLEEKEVEVEPQQQQQKNSQPATAASRRAVASSTSRSGISDIVAPEKTLREFIDLYMQRMQRTSSSESDTFVQYLNCCLNMPFVDKCLLVNNNEAGKEKDEALLGSITHNGNLRTREDIIFLWSLLPELAMTRANSTVDGDPSSSNTNNNTSVSSRGADKGQSKTLSPVDSNVPQERGGRGGGVTQCSTNYGSSSSGGTDEGKNCSSKTPSQEEDEETGAVTESLNHRAAGVVPVTGANYSNSKANNVNSASQDDEKMDEFIIYSSDEDIDATSSKPTNPTCRKQQGSQALPGKKKLEQDVPGKLGAASLLASRKVVGGDSDDDECAAGANVTGFSMAKYDQEQVEAFAQPPRKRKSLDAGAEQGTDDRPPKSQRVGTATTPVSTSTPCAIAMAMAKESVQHPEHQQRKPSALSPSTAPTTETPAIKREWEFERSNELSTEERSRLKDFFEDRPNPTPHQSIYRTVMHEERRTHPRSGRPMTETYHMELDYDTKTFKRSRSVKYHEKEEK